ncbi:NapC/NirT family cytochrome c [Sulfurimonas sp.]|uniref:cytochrome c3 family protein n=1 Tax=Sulfurimonas sp. TaxID=2022749 RepID=UPI0026348D66|nr:NapC/NirT family cytochrome c [Sulfurimonas sp.]
MKQEGNHFSKVALLVIVLIGVGIGSMGSFTTAVMVEKTSGEDFCAQCHTMEPMTQSYLADIHGGNNKEGLRAKCVDCHLPHDSLFSYLVEKAKTGTHDVWAELTYDKSKIDWQEKRKHAKHFVYDSGCLHCHSNLEEATMGSAKAFVAHKAYFLDKKKKCVECHSNVGHHNLGDYISKTGIKEK